MSQFVEASALGRFPHPGAPAVGNIERCRRFDNFSQAAFGKLES
jgi:hypothetical protein